MATSEEKLRNMENLIKMITERIGISESQAKAAVDTVLSFVKEKMPAGMDEQVESFIKGGDANLGGISDSLKD